MASEIVTASTPVALQPVVEAPQKFAARLRIVFPRILAIENDRHHRVRPLASTGCAASLMFSIKCLAASCRRHAGIDEADEVGDRVIAKYHVHRVSTFS